MHEAARFNVVACGRRWGKTTLGVDRIVRPALEGYPAAWFSPTYKMLTDVWRDVRRTVLPITKQVSAQEHRIELVTGGIIDMWSLDSPDVARGRKYKRVGIDEAAMVRDLGDAWQAVIRPTLADFEGDAWLFSTPKGRNAFWTMFQSGQDSERPDWRSWRMPTSANPHIAPGEIDAMRHEMPEQTYQQEILAEFLEDGGGVFRRVRDAATATAQSEPVDGHVYVVGVDWGKLADWTVLALLDATTRELVAVERFNQIDYVTQRGRLTALCERFKPNQIVAERNSIGEPVIEQLQRDGLPVQPFTTTNASKASAVDALALAFERGDIRILNDAALIGELQAFEATRLPSGMLRYAAPEGMHDDMVMALALGWQAVATGEIALAPSLWT